MKTIFLFLLITGTTLPLWAGSEVKARLESTANLNAWVEIDVLIDQGKARLNFQGPFSRGSLIYDKNTEDIVIVDDLNRMVIPIGSAAQSTFKMAGYMASSSLKHQAENGIPSVRMAYRLAEDNAQALFNGEGMLKQKNIHMDGFLCDQYQTVVKGEKVRDVWMTPLTSTGISSDDYRTLWNLTEKAIDLLAPELKQMGVDPDLFLRSYSNLQFPVHAGLFVKGKLSCRYKTQEVHSRTVDTDAFLPPAGYRTMSLMGLIQQGM
jgi:hypothetical protein